MFFPPIILFVGPDLVTPISPYSIYIYILTGRKSNNMEVKVAIFREKKK
jgi:hypothetical protein